MTVRVAVTTTAGRAADRIIALSEGCGLVPVLLPCIRVEPAADGVLDELRAAAESADWIVVTSPRAVEIVWPEAAMPSRPATAAVGATTADAVRRAGGAVALSGSGGAASLRELLDGRVGGTAAVFPHARGADGTMARWLAQHCSHLVAAAVYATESLAPAGDPVDAVIFGSPSAVAGWRKSRGLSGIVVAAMGPTTAAYLESVGRPPDVVPGSPGAAAIVEAVAAHVASNERHAS
ncbi:MAG: uroporphyrinogen-III synthase [Acidimicrobiia bacterium]